MNEEKKKITIAIDGPASSGKGTTARGVAQKLAYAYLDTGALYRMVALHCLRDKKILENEAKIADALELIHMEFRPDGRSILSGQDVTKDIRSPYINSKVSTVFARIQAVRDFVTRESQLIVASGGYVLDGRDAGAVIAPHAQLKIYLDCDASERARRRALEFGSGDEKQIETILHEIIEPRDKADKETITRAKEEGVTIDTTNMTIEQQIDHVSKLALEIINH